MENRTRVSDIKKKFEKLKVPNNLEYSVCDEPVSEDALRAQCVIKRSNAFRTDRPGQPSRSHDYPTANIEEFRGPNNLVGANIFALNNLRGVVSTPNLINAKHQNSFDSRPHSSSSTSTQQVPPRNRKLVHPSLNPPRSKNTNISQQVPNKSFPSRPTDLQSRVGLPLPPGPPPKKPPRTFQYNQTPSSSSSFTKNLYGVGIPLAHLDTTVPFSRPPRFWPPQRSKTESHIVLKKYDSPSQTNPYKTGLPQPQQFHQNNLHSQITFDALNCASNVRRHVYDTPYDPAYNFLNDLNRSPKQKDNVINKQKIYGIIQGSNSLEPRFNSESAMSRKSDPTHQDSIEMGSAVHPSSLHYMSSPIQEGDPHVGRPFPAQPGVNGHEETAGKRQIQVLLDEAFSELDAKSPDSDSDYSVNDDIASRERLTAERKGYVQRVTSLLSPQRSVIFNSHNLFDMLLLIGLDSDPERGRIPYIKDKYPEGVVPPGYIEELVFPDSTWPPPSPVFSNNNYTVVLTNEDGSRKYAYCRRLQPEGSPFCLPLAYTIVTVHKAPGFYYSLLAEIEARHGEHESEFVQFVRQLYESSLPSPGQSLTITRSMDGLFLKRPIDIRQEDTSLNKLLQIATVPVFLQIFSTMLLERKIILIGSNIGTLSVCMEGLQAALLPFEWQHTLVTAVPKQMVDLCQAPTPYIVGLLKDIVESISLNAIDEALIVDIDGSAVVQRVGDEGSILPNRLIKCLRNALPVSLQADSASSSAIASEAIIRIFVELVGHYRDHIITSVDSGKRQFQRDTFIKATNSKSIQLFLEWFTETAMFNEFIEARLSRNFHPGIFEQRCTEFIAENVRNSKKSKSLNRTVNRTVKTLGKTRDRFMDWASSS